MEEGAESGIPLQQMGPVREEGDGSADPVQETQSDKAEYPMTYAAITKSESGEQADVHDVGVVDGILARGGEG